MDSALWVSALSSETPTILLSKQSLYQWWVNRIGLSSLLHL